MIDEWYLNAHEVDYRLLRLSPFPQHQQLLRHDRQHFDIDSIELVETDPGAPLRETAEQLPHHLVIDLITAVEDDTLNAQRLRQIFRRLCLARAYVLYYIMLRVKRDKTRNCYNQSMYV